MLLLWQHPADANIMAPPKMAAEMGGPLGPNTPLEVQHEELTFRCHTSGERPVCDVEATYVVHNPTENTQSTEARFVGYLTSRVDVTIDGEKAVPVNDAGAKVASAGDTGPLAAEPPHVLSSFPLESELIPWQEQWPFEVTLAADQTSRIEVRGRMFPMTHTRDAFGHTVSANRTRHSYLSTDSGLPSYEFLYTLSPLRSWSGQPNIAVTIEFPVDWDVSTDLWKKHDRINADDEEADENQATPEVGASSDHIVAETGTTRRTFTISATDFDGLSIRAEMPDGFEVDNGGPFVAFGAHRGGPARWRLAAGYEIEVNDLFLASLAVETDFHGGYLLTPLATVTTPNVMYIVPSLGLGVGPTFQLAPQFSPGGRVELSLLYPVIGGLVCTLDYFPPGSSHQEQLTQWGLFWRIGL